MVAGAMGPSGASVGFAFNWPLVAIAIAQAILPPRLATAYLALVAM